MNSMDSMQNTVFFVYLNHFLLVRENDIFLERSIQRSNATKSIRNYKSQFMESNFQKADIFHLFDHIVNRRSVSSNSSVNFSIYAFLLV